MTELSDEDFFRFFNPSAGARLKKLEAEKLDLVHYTSASNAMRILRDKQITLRNSTLMNDFLEIEHGENCLAEAWKSNLGKGSEQSSEGRLARVLNSFSPTILPAVEQQFNASWGQRKTDTFIISLAEHNEATEGELGRLSMWRAYGGQTNVALVVSPEDVIAGEADELASTPVHYCSEEDFLTEHFNKLVCAIEENAEQIKQIDRDHIVFYLNWVLNSFAISVKHPGFLEEKEWRIFNAPWLSFDHSIDKKVINIQGVPQAVSQINLNPDPDAEGPRAMHRILKKVIVGPSQYPSVLYDAFCRELEALGFESPNEMVVVSNIPIRR